MRKRIVSAWVVLEEIDSAGPVILVGCHDCLTMMKDQQALKSWQLPYQYRCPTEVRTYETSVSRMRVAVQ